MAIGCSSSTNARCAIRPAARNSAARSGAGRSRVPLQRQLYDEIRTAILSGRLAPGARVPATRVLASDTGTSRNTVSGAFDQLLSEGYLEGKVGSGTYVARTLPEDLLRVTRQPGPSRPLMARACL